MLCACGQIYLGDGSRDVGLHGPMVCGPSSMPGYLEAAREAVVESVDRAGRANGDAAEAAEVEIEQLKGRIAQLEAQLAAHEGAAEAPDATSYLGVAPDAASRKGVPIMEGCLDYFPAALAAVAAVSKAGNDQHNPGQPMHWSRGKSGDHANCAARHLIDRGRIDSDGHRHSAKAAWRTLANLQEELEAAGVATMPRAAWVDKK